MSQFKVGDVVALQSHPYSDKFINIVFSGDPQTNSPLMVIIEVLIETKTQYDEKTGNLLLESGKSQCRCTWFSNKTHQFEDKWLHSGLLKIVKHADKLLEERYVKSLINSEVLFKTSDLELKKRKSSMSYKDHPENGKVSITPLLSFVSPVLHVIQVIEVKKSDFKEPIYDARSGQQKRFIPTWMIKCQWFNLSSDKMSEKLLPVEALTILTKANEDYVDSLNKAIETSVYLKNEKLLLSPKMLTYKNGRYYLQAFDFIKNKTREIDIIRHPDLSIIAKYYSNKGPYFNPLTADTLSIEDAINLAIKAGVYLRIQYKKKNGDLTTRTLSKLSIEKANNLKGVMTTYLKAYCHLRKAERLFKLKRILDLEVLDLQAS
jgi:uncharacterized protein YodC (DUF2158 family)